MASGRNPFGANGRPAYYDRDPANELARYADTLDPRTRKASGIVVILGQTPDQDRAYRVEPHTFSALSDATSSLDRFTFDIGGNSLGSMQV